MKRLLLLSLATIIQVLCIAQNSMVPKSHRIEKTINTQWTFNYFPEEDSESGGDSEPAGYEFPAFDDSRWSAIAIPHTWMTYETTGELHPYIKNASSNDDPYWWNGIGWYRKRLVIGEEFKDKKIFVEFDAVQKYSKVWLNGIYLGDHKGGFTSFYFDISDAVNFGEENILVVSVNNTMKDEFQIPPMSAGNWDIYGGITRDVRLVIKEKVFIPYQGSYKHEGGTFVSTPEVNESEGVTNIRTFIKNEFTKKKKIKLVSIITDAEDMVIEKITQVKTIPPGEIVQFDQSSKPIKNIKLWSPENPYVYNVFSEVYDGKNLIDNYYSPLGFRWFHWDFDEDLLYLNGQTVWIHGQNRHEEYVWLGGAFPKWMGLRDMHDIRYGLEHNFMRTAHYPHDPSIYDFTDRNGIFINEEVPNIKNQDFDETVQEQNLREMIRRDRNHPSIFFWSMGNETTDAADSKWAYEEDSTRIITSRHIYNDSKGDYAPHSEKNWSIEGFLRCTIKGWYDTDERDLEPKDQQHAGTEVNDVLRALDKDVQDHYGSVWLYADHGADREYLNSPLKHVNPKGWVDSWRNPKYKYYLWQANYASRPMVFIHYHFWREKYLGQKKDFMVHSNCNEVELFINGNSKGKKHPEKSNQYTVKFEQLEIEQGSIKAVGTNTDGSTVNYIIEMAGEADRIILQPSSEISQAGLNEVVEIRADIVDAKGVHVIGANPRLKWTVEGPATLVGAENYISDINGIEEYEGTLYIDVPVTNIIRSTGKAGKVTVTVTSGSLKAGETEIVFEEYLDSNPIEGISEPSLKSESRERVQKNQSQISRIIAPSEMKKYQGELNFRLTELENEITRFITSENPGIPANTADFKYVVKIFSQMMKANKGRLVADDYNFTVEQYNISRDITRYIDKADLPRAYKDELIDYYARLIVLNGRNKNIISQKEIISEIPSGGKTVIVDSEIIDYPDLIYSKETDLKKVLGQVYPETQYYSEDDMEKAWRLIYRINPSILYSSTRDRKTKVKTEYYTIEPGRVILIPLPKKLLKNNFPDIKI